MTTRFPIAPPPPQCLPPSRPSEETRAFLALRRSAGKLTLSAPGPSAHEVDELLQIAARAPDHRKLEPWRFIVFENESRAQFGQQIANFHAVKHPDASERDLDEERGRFLRAPVVVAVVSSPDKAHKTPVWEQELSCGAVCYNLLLAANAAGWAGCWLTEWLAFDDEVASLLGLTQDERIAGFIYLGTATAEPPERPRPDMSSLITRWRD